MQCSIKTSLNLANFYRQAFVSGLMFVFGELSAQRVEYQIGSRVSTSCAPRGADPDCVDDLLGGSWVVISRVISPLI